VSTNSLDALQVKVPVRKQILLAAQFAQEPPLEYWVAEHITGTADVDAHEYPKLIKLRPPK
jgi:hypothetical protein